MKMQNVMLGSEEKNVTTDKGNNNHKWMSREKIVGPIPKV